MKDGERPGLAGAPHRRSFCRSIASRADGWVLFAVDFRRSCSTAEGLCMQNPPGPARRCFFIGSLQLLLGRLAVMCRSLLLLALVSPAPLPTRCQPTMFATSPPTPSRFPSCAYCKLQCVPQWRTLDFRSLPLAPVGLQPPTDPTPLCRFRLSCRFALSHLGDAPVPRSTLLFFLLSRDFTDPCHRIRVRRRPRAAHVCLSSGLRLHGHTDHLRRKASGI